MYNSTLFLCQPWMEGLSGKYVGVDGDFQTLDVTAPYRRLLVLLKELA